MPQSKDFVIDAHQPDPGARLGMASGEDLQAFQASLLARIAARPAGSLQARRLAVRIGQHDCLIALDHAGEILPLGKQLLTPVPATRHWFLGLLNIRGNLVGVADLAAMAGEPAQSVGPESHILVMSQRLAPQCGLLVARVAGLRDIAEMSRISKNYEDGNDLRGVTGRYKDRHGKCWSELDLNVLSQDPEFLRVGR